ncbi:hypothetical protein HPB47_005705 [Ixodes persulcatus]|uniref:Uncharacterized protein n=1 Tax=Ixodes persulcatus TaxID=34615 RepID=A0AC60PCI3_IXOPE|nr:hypothetical protein HPB47_005705 [Ixodes persulcatus]
MFVEGKVAFGDYFDNLLSWYEHRHNTNVSFLTYEDLKKDTVAWVIKIADFLGEEYGRKLRSDQRALGLVLKRTPSGPNPPQGQQLPPPSGESTLASPESQDRQATPVPVFTSTTSPRKKERHSSPNSLERASSSKERHSSRSTPPISKGQERVD